MESTFDRVSRASQGDAQAISSLLAEHLPALRTYIACRAGSLVLARESVSDLAQSVCREVLEDLDDFEYRGEQAFRGWLYQEAWRKIVDRVRFHKADKRREPEGFGQGAPEDVTDFDIDTPDWITPSRAASGREELGRVIAAFGELPEDYREAVLLHRVARLPHKEIATLMQRSEGAVRNLVHRGLAKLSILLDGS